MSTEDDRFISLALDCAAVGRGKVEPNPMVGAVIVRDGRELSRGWHRRFGGPHAEREALEAARKCGLDVRGATMYVTLEPCCHRGKTPPCTDAIIEAGIARVVAAMLDPDEKVDGQGLEALRVGGIEVDVGVCESAARQFLGGYVKLRTRKRPWVICKWAQTADGYLSVPSAPEAWISGPAARRRVHEIRSWCDGILVGVETVLADDPRLTDRSGRGSDNNKPVRVVLDAKLRTPLESQLVVTARRIPVLVVAASGAAAARPQAAEALRGAGVELLELPAAAAGVDIEALLDELGRRQWTYLLVEGGPRVLGSFVYGHLADELLAFVSNVELGRAPAAAVRFDIAEVRERLGLHSGAETQFGPDVLLRYVLRQ
ncbi:MAG: bifunctional diaminohydroxyphosphoribosylaminopyrimidine deaminase/5-amino-6-(5-phosphoribosylamino)uracil reductase RibD [Phycisphaerae bacterium]|jgi:diaminohydroxyphosphoribosylaminopyrimidine deaminase/5-amino-6-(5-phosphoribosylamino)uracil reductase|nr:bifunctional diaminohydroxyphosphoribosylaminopyrimidine deaminase/5-amino-6-(5-phosphoribosylamino)uracil reductase RibD [Phycisphaerae bacterium]MDP7637349.1 bifunctional diaminohydroxyphosphoribosylaminopyrimidine deaminase/5-amino-6-(5-phosphoribosylamino)uracil reductase RibD [Phycisphaerae bacterium]